MLIYLFSLHVVVLTKYEIQTHLIYFKKMLGSMPDPLSPFVSDGLSKAEGMPIYIIYIYIYTYKFVYKSDGLKNTVGWTKTVRMD